MVFGARFAAPQRTSTPNKACDYGIDAHARQRLTVSRSFLISDNPNRQKASAQKSKGAWDSCRSVFLPALFSEGFRLARGSGRCAFFLVIIRSCIAAQHEDREAPPFHDLFSPRAERESPPARHTMCGDD